MSKYQHLNWWFLNFLEQIIHLFIEVSKIIRVRRHTTWVEVSRLFSFRRNYRFLDEETDFSMPLYYLVAEMLAYFGDTVSETIFLYLNHFVSRSNIPNNSFSEDSDSIKLNWNRFTTDLVVDFVIKLLNIVFRLFFC